MTQIVPLPVQVPGVPDTYFPLGHEVQSLDVEEHVVHEGSHAKINRTIFTLQAVNHKQVQTPYAHYSIRLSMVCIIVFPLVQYVCHYLV